VLPVYVTSLATKWADVIARCWETLAGVQMVMDSYDMGCNFKGYILVVSNLYKKFRLNHLFSINQCMFSLSELHFTTIF